MLLNLKVEATHPRFIVSRRKVFVRAIPVSDV
jgi:hypothetical protein